MRILVETLDRRHGRGWPLHCHRSHHTMNAMGHGIPNPIGADPAMLEEEIRKVLPGHMAMGRKGMVEHQQHARHMPGPRNTLPMMTDEGPFGPMEMGGMCTVVKVRDDLTGAAAPGCTGARGTVAAPTDATSRSAHVARSYGHQHHE